jgi:hypothetical protein
MKRVVIFYGGPVSGLVDEVEVNREGLTFAAHGIYEVVADMAFYTGLTFRIMRKP